MVRPRREAFFSILVLDMVALSRLFEQRGKIGDI